MLASAYAPAPFRARSPPALTRPQQSADPVSREVVIQQAVDLIELVVLLLAALTLTIAVWQHLDGVDRSRSNGGMQQCRVALPTLHPSPRWGAESHIRVVGPSDVLLKISDRRRTRQVTDSSERKAIPNHHNGICLPAAQAFATFR